jgi:hypothetical protein
LDHDGLGVPPLHPLRIAARVDDADWVARDPGHRTVGLWVQVREFDRTTRLVSLKWNTFRFFAISDR